MTWSRTIAIAALAGCKISNVTFTGDDDIHVDAPPDTADLRDVTIRVYDGPFATGATHDAELVGFRDGDGAWQALVGQDGVYHAHVDADRFGVAMGCTTPTSKTMRISERALHEGPNVDLIRCSVNFFDSTTSGHVTGLSQNDIAVVAANLTATQVFGSGDGSWQLSTLGNTDMFATLVVGAVATSTIRRRDVTGGSTVDFDFVSEGKPVVTDSFTAHDASGTVSTYLEAPNGYYPLAPFTSPNNLPPTSYQQLPAGMLGPDELYDVQYQGTNNRTASKLTRGGPVEVQLMPELSVPAPTLVNDPAPRVTWTLPPSAITSLPVVLYSMSATTTDPFTLQSRTWSIDISEAWARASATTSYALPDLSEIDPTTHVDYALLPHASVTSFLQVYETSSLVGVVGVDTHTASQVDTIPNP